MHKESECRECGKIFNDRASLKKHLTVHGDKLVSIRYFDDFEPGDGLSFIFTSVFP
jgi:hypothetical protein